MGTNNPQPFEKPTTLTWRELALKINALSEEQKDTDVTVQTDTGEFFAAKLCFAEGDDVDVLDADHPFLIVDN